MAIQKSGEAVAISILKCLKCSTANEELPISLGMGWDFLFKQIWQERDLTQAIANKMNAEFEKHRDCYYFIKTKRRKNGYVQVVYVKSFNSLAEAEGFYWDSKYDRACVLVRYQGDHYYVHCSGFYYCNCFSVYKNYMKLYREFRGQYDIEKYKMVLRDLVSSAFCDIKKEFKIF